jgi:hypothetical protein
MKLYVLLIIGFALSMSGCGNKEQAAPEQEAEAPATAPAAEPMAADKESYYFDGIVKHMHSHADQVDVIDIALDDDDLEAAKLPARWLWRHDRMSDVPTDWLPYLVSMREAARAVESATDLETARAASKRITEQCQACHIAAGVFDNGVEQDGD